MLFKDYLVDAMVAGQKITTLRVAKGHQVACWNAAGAITEIRESEGGRIKWRVGHDYVVQAKYGTPGVLWHPKRQEWKKQEIGVIGHSPGWCPLRIKVKRLFCLHVHDLSLQYCIFEGVTPVDNGAAFVAPDCPNDKHLTPRLAFADMWDRINKKKGTRWEDNPFCWGVLFEVVV